jgi:methylmalonyl-CoA/ethylmalonyl-CoA epimerase
MITQIHHIGIAVKSLQENIPFYRDVLKLEFLGTEQVPEQKVQVAMFRTGEVNIELLEPIAPDSPVAQFIDKRGEGIHHIAYQTDDLEKTIEFMADKGIEMIDKIPRSGAHDTKIAFIHPRSSKKILSELCEIKGEQA